MVILKDYINEYLMICKILKEKGYRMPLLKDCIAMEKIIFEKVLQANNFDDCRNKLRIWKNLNWIQTDKTRYTKVVRMKNKSKRMIVVDLKPSYVLSKIPIPR